MAAVLNEFYAKTLPKSFSSKPHKWIKGLFLIPERISARHTNRVLLGKISARVCLYVMVCRVCT